MESKFSGSREFARLEALPLHQLLRDVKFGLVELDRLARGRLRESVQGVKVAFGADLATIERASSEATVDPELVHSVRVGFERRLRDGTRAGPLRPQIERLTVLLRILELRVASIAAGLDPQQVASYRRKMMSDLWSEPVDARATDDPGFDWRALPAELHNAWLARLEKEWSTLNWYYLEGGLRPPVFELSESKEQLGRWIGDRRAIAISGWHVVTHSWHEVVETLKHEMAHQVVAELWQKAGASPHGPEFRAACEKLRCAPSGSADASRMARVEHSNDPVDRIVSRIQKLLRLSESPNQHEATLAMERASKLLAKFNLDVETVQRDRSFFRRRVGPVLTRRDEHHHNLAVLLSDHFFVRIIWVSSYLPLTGATGVQMELIGTRENLDVSEYVHDFLIRTTEQLWQQHRASDAYRGGRKAQFFAGVTSGFQEKLDSQRAQLVRERALVWRADSKLEEHLDHLYPRRATSRLRGVARGEDYHVGVEQGREITLRMGVPGQAGGRQLLPRGSDSD